MNGLPHNKRVSTIIPAPPPSPLLPAALAACVAIGLSDALPTYALAFCVAGVIFAALAFCGLFLAHRPFVPAGILRGTVIVGLAFAVGAARYRQATALSDNHVAGLVGTEPILTRLTGLVLNDPVIIAGEKHNPYLPYAPQPRARFLLAAEMLDVATPPREITGLLQVSVQTDHSELRSGDRIRLAGRLYRQHGPQNPGEIDWARINRLEGVQAGLFVEDAALVEKLAAAEPGWRTWLGALRRYARRTLSESYAAPDDDEGRGLLEAMIIGQRDAVSRALNDAFIKTGTIHVLSVSGFHFGLLAGWVYWLSRIARASPRTASLITLPIILLFAIVAEPNAPLLRSALISVLLCATQLIERRPAPLNWLAFAALILLAWNPLQLFQPGFQLTFVQVAALILVIPTAKQMLRRPRNQLGPPPDEHVLWRLVLRRFVRLSLVALFISTVMWLVSLPLILHHFGRFSPWAAFQTVLLTPPVELVTMLGFLTELIALFFLPAAKLLGYALSVATQWLVWAVHLLAGLPGALVETPHPPTWLVVLTYAALVAAFLLARRRLPAFDEHGTVPYAPRIALSVPLPLAIVWLGWFLAPAVPIGPQLCVLSVGNGSAAILTDGKGQAAVFDVGTTRNADAGETAATALKTFNVRSLSQIFLSHADFDHYGGLESLVSAYPPQRVISTQAFAADLAHTPHMRRIADVLQAQLRPPEPARFGDAFALGSLPLEILWPPADLPQRTPNNDTSLVVALRLGATRVIIPGDIADGAMLGLLQLASDGVIDLHADILIAPHHGSTTARHAPEFYRAVAPQYVIVSTANPRPKLAALLHHELGENCRVLETGASGAITISVDSRGSPRIQGFSQ